MIYFDWIRHHTWCCIWYTLQSNAVCKLSISQSFVHTVLISHGASKTAPVADATLRQANDASCAKWSGFCQSLWLCSIHTTVDVYTTICICFVSSSFSVMSIVWHLDCCFLSRSFVWAMALNISIHGMAVFFHVRRYAWRIIPGVRHVRLVKCNRKH